MWTLELEVVTGLSRQMVANGSGLLRQVSVYRLLDILTFYMIIKLNHLFTEAGSGHRNTMCSLRECLIYYALGLVLFISEFIVLDGMVELQKTHCQQ